MTDLPTPTAAADRAAFRTAAADAPPEARVPVELRPPVTDPFDASVSNLAASCGGEDD